MAKTTINYLIDRFFICADIISQQIFRGGKLSGVFGHPNSSTRLFPENYERRGLRVPKGVIFVKVLKTGSGP